MNPELPGPLPILWRYKPIESAARIKHSIDEIGNFEFFLPTLYAAENKKNRVQAVAV